MGMMFSMNSHPLTRSNPRRYPDQKTEDFIYDWVKGDCFVGQLSVKVEGSAKNSELEG